MGEASDIVDAALYLQNATFVTGENICVDRADFKAKLWSSDHAQGLKDSGWMLVWKLIGLPQTTSSGFLCYKCRDAMVNSQNEMMNIFDDLRNSE